MRLIGLIGGMSAESTAHYYAHLNALARERLGGVHSARILLWSFDFAELEEMQRAGNWEEIARRLGEAARTLESAGADFFLICANTMHKIAAKVQAQTRLPLLHIVDVTAAAIRAASPRKVGLLGTAYTMEDPFFRDRLAHFGIEAIVPGEADRKRCHEIIFQELVKGIVREESRAAYAGVIERLKSAGAEAIILGCTELSMVVDTAAAPLPCFDTAALHAKAAIDAALDEATFARLSAGTNRKAHHA